MLPLHNECCWLLTCMRLCVHLLLLLHAVPPCIQSWQLAQVPAGRLEPEDAAARASCVTFSTAKDEAPLLLWMQQHADSAQTEQLLRSLAGLGRGKAAAAVFMFDEAAAAAGSTAPFTCLQVCKKLTPTAGSFAAVQDLLQQFRKRLRKVPKTLSELAQLLQEACDAAAPQVEQQQQQQQAGQMVPVLYLQGQVRLVALNESCSI